LKQWVPKLKHVPKEYIHEPWKLTKEQQLEYSVQLGMDYPNPFIDLMIGEAQLRSGQRNRNDYKIRNFCDV
jgi:deoxyribodipyrimidine photo-lyase